MSDPESHLAGYRSEAPQAFVPPPMDWFVTTARRRSRQKLATAAAGLAVFALTGGAVFTAQRGGPGPAPAPIAPPSATATTPPTPSGTPSTGPSASGSPSPGGSSATSQPGRSSENASNKPGLNIRAVNWKEQFSLALPDPGPDSTCPTGRLTVRAEEGKLDGKVVKASSFDVLGDLTGDGQPEAVLLAHCEVDSEYASGDGSGNLLVVTVRDGKLVGLGYVGPEGHNYPKARISGGVLTVTVEQRYGQQLRQQRGYRWNGTRFEQVSGPTKFPSG